MFRSPEIKLSAKTSANSKTKVFSHLYNLILHFFEIKRKDRKNQNSFLGQRFQWAGELYYFIISLILRAIALLYLSFFDFLLSNFFSDLFSYFSDLISF